MGITHASLASETLPHRRKYFGMFAAANNFGFLSIAYMWHAMAE